MFPIITVTGVADPLPGIDKLLMATALRIIDAAKKYDGVLVEISENENMMDGIPKGKTAVRFNIIFKNEEEFRKGVEGLQRELG
jgi:hypothetical protein